MAQSAANVQVAWKAQPGLGTPAAGTGASGFRAKASQSMKLNKTAIPSEEVRRDGQTTRGRQGSRSASAAYSAELSVGSFDELLQAATRGTWTAAATIAATTVTNITTTTNTIHGASGSFLTSIKRGDMIKLTSSHTAGNNGKWLRVLFVTASDITLPTASLTADATTDTAATITIAKNVIMGTTPVERYFSLEEYLQDLDQSLYATDCKVTKIDFNAQPNKNIEVTFTFMGLDVQPQTSAGSPVFTPTPTYTTTLPLVMSDGTIRISGTDYTLLTGFSFSLDLGGAVTPTLSTKSPDVFLSNAKLTGSFSAIRGDLTFFSANSAETQLEFFITCSENEANPADFIQFYIGNLSLSDVTAAIAQDGPMQETMNWSAGIDQTGSDHAVTMIKIATSAA